MDSLINYFNLPWGHEAINIEVIEGKELPNSNIFFIAEKDMKVFYIILNQLKRDKNVAHLFFEHNNERGELRIQTVAGSTPKVALFQAVERIVNDLKQLQRDFQEALKEKFDV